ncbi:kinase phosphorylation protein-domain-containing protein [Panaeolus papilionaceus]|nr:kinase phosphorylation protein-domain-containing protein [Panaeolus papilionaceus]
MFEPVRGGTRGGQAEFKWSDVSADKDRENYLGHSINAPTGRWQKNKDIHWYNRDKDQTDAERNEEIRRIKQLEADAIAAALGYEPTTSGNASGANATAIPSSSNGDKFAGLDPDKALEKEEKRKRKEERRAEKKARKELKRLSQTGAHGLEDLRAKEKEHTRRHRSRSRSPRYRSRERRTRDERRPRSRSRSRTPPEERRSRTNKDEPYGEAEREREREMDRRRWEANRARDMPSDRRNY